MAFSNETLKEILLKDGVVNKEDVEQAEAESKRTSVPFTRVLVSEGKLTQEYLSQLISKYLDIPLLDLRSQPLKSEIVELVPENIARQRQILVIDKDAEKNKYKVGMADPTDVDNINFLKEYLKGEIDAYLVIPDDLRFGYQIYKKKSSQEFEKSIAAKIKELKKKSDGNILESIPLTELFDVLLDYAAILDASDIYFIPQEDSLKVRFRVDGLLREIISVDKSLNDGMVARIKTLSGMRIDEHLKPQDGRFRFHSRDIDFDVRTAIMPTLFGEKVTIRLLTSSQSFISFEELGMSETMSGILKVAAKKPFGMILSSGPTGSGKTTTIYALLTMLNKPEVHITTIEDPIEYIIPNVSQTQVNLQAGITFASGVRALLRHNPDIIFIGEIRDAETADNAVNAALTGHLLISTIHTTDAVSAIIRLIELGIAPFLTDATLNAVLAQRLVRKVCVSCIESYEPSAPMARQLEEQSLRLGKKLHAPKIVFKGKGCPVCGFTGYKGRIGIFEILILSEKIRKIISGPNLTLDALRKAAYEEGMISILEDGVDKIERGLTTIEEIFRVLSE